jgi:hypothetical protein
MAYEAYQALLSVTGSSVRDRNIIHTKKTLESSFSDSPSFFSVQIDGIYVDSWILDDSDVKDQKKIICPLHNLRNGEIIEWQAQQWINIISDNMSDIYYRGTLKRCVGQLKWVDSDGSTKHHPFTFKSDTATNFGVSDGKVMTLGNERRILIAPLNDDTRTISKDKRFIFDGRAWIVTAIDRISVDGLIIVTVDENLLSKENDNLELEIADYYNNITTPPPSSAGSDTPVILGADECRVGQSEVYTVNSLEVTWSLFAEDQTTSTDLASVTQNANNCILQANNQKKYGYVNLVATSVSDSSKKNVKRIKVRSLI